MKKLLASLLLFAGLGWQAWAIDYDVREFGALGNGRTMNTNIIQNAIDYISEKGGGRLIFYPGRYLSGSIYLKSGVTLHLESGAVILGSQNPLDYETHQASGWPALVFAINQKDIAITGKGEINGQGWESANNLVNLIHKGIVKDKFDYDRPRAWRHQNIYFWECENIVIQDIMLRSPGAWNNTYERCKNVLVTGLRADSNAFWNDDGIDIVDCDGVVIRDCDLDGTDDIYCFKSHSGDHICQNILLEDCVGRSSANGIKFGTVSRGGFKNVVIRNVTIYNTYRSAVTFAAADGAEVENIEIDGLHSINNGNVFFFLISDRWSGGKVPYMRNITIKNVYAEVPFDKPDAGYPFEGPIEDLPRNISPSIITGRTDIPIENMTFQNIEIVYPGGGDPFYAYVGTSEEELDKIPERPEAYPEFSMYKELPAWGFYIRHAKGITFDNVRIRAAKKDYRVPFVLDDTHDITFKNVTATEPDGQGKEMVVSVRSSDIRIEK